MQHYAKWYKVAKGAGRYMHGQIKADVLQRPMTFAQLYTQICGVHFLTPCHN